ncbi:DUF3889 domain-containing protein [Paenibacillus sp. Soil724D2]|uniref:DUF3889 domain-containing protein n=1 Tax=Paenibacillus sp. (strain Soil724D2) TaxID=1736392 RepID=UPI0007149465|nr:DUF3889 domain-containing protein [Paenibacillus sp. Soil724D2]KRE36657.1 hypothetical protein ASG85_10975 [Paenibacillus sp. Soil724D2]
MDRILAVLLIIWFGWSGSLIARVEASAETRTEISTEEIFVKYKPVQDPEYAKWSRLAFQEAGKLYTLLDYKYLGRSTIAPGVAQQQFRFWVRHHGVEFPLIVSIRYDPITEKVFTIDMEQEKRGNLPIL